MPTYPDTDLARRAATHAEAVSPAWLFHHCLRAYLFAREIGRAEGLEPGADYDDELLFIGCVLHDLGATTEGRYRFEVVGADLAAEFLAGAGVDADRIDVVWDAIALHTSHDLLRRRRPEIRLVQAGSGLDMLGGLERLTPEFVAAVLADLPRDGAPARLTDLLVGQALRNPRAGLPLTFVGEIVRQRYPETSLPTWDDLIQWADSVG